MFELDGQCPHATFRTKFACRMSPELYSATLGRLRTVAGAGGLRSGLDAGPPSILSSPMAIPLSYLRMVDFGVAVRLHSMCYGFGWPIPGLFKRIE